MGKSTLINTLFGKNTARVSNTPGKTKGINVFHICKNLYFFDLPGYGYAKVSKDLLQQWGPLMEHFFRLLPPSVAIISVQDARHINQRYDQTFFEYFESLEHFKNDIFLVCNKIDKLKNQRERIQFEKEKGRMFEENRHIISEIFSVSAEKKRGIGGLKSFLLNFLRNS